MQRGRKVDPALLRCPVQSGGWPMQCFSCVRHRPSLGDGTLSMAADGTPTT